MMITPKKKEESVFREVLHESDEELLVGTDVLIVR
jgi:hypothetical protein